MLPKRHFLALALCLAAVLLMTWLAYAPGLHGGFLFDDFANLPSLGDSGPIDNWSTFWRYITSGTADPTGRPLTLLSFLLDARDWPADPFPFKRTNLILHLLNGLLLYLLLFKLSRSLTFDNRRCQVAAVFGSALWLLHPLLVSTTLYIVQREAMLPATFALAGLLIWLHGRSQLAIGKSANGLFWNVLGLGAFTLLGVLAKANGALLPLYALLIEAIVLTPRHPLPAGKIRRDYHVFLSVFAVFPAAVIGFYLVWIGVHGIITGGPAMRPWTYAQRLLTEPRVLIDYLQLLWLPRPFSSGLFNDQYLASTSLWRPITTLPAIVALLALIGAAWRLRLRYPAIALAVLLYFAGQLLESTSIPLELYFEHRNYLPALFMFWPLGLWLADLRTLSTFKRVIMIVLPISLALMTHVRAEVWGNVREQAMIWARVNPESPRAQANAAQIEIQNGQPQSAIPRLEKMLSAQPNQMQLAFNLIGARCMMGGVGASDLSAARQAISTAVNTGTLLEHWFDNMIPVASSGDCSGITLPTLLDLIDSGLHNPRLREAGQRQDLIYLRGRIALAQHNPEAALADFIEALDFQITPDIALSAAASLGAAGYPTQGLRMLDHYHEVQKNALPAGMGMPMLHAWVMAHQNYWSNELAHLRSQLRADASKHETNTAPPINLHVIH